MGKAYYSPTWLQPALTLDFGIPPAQKHTNVPYPLWDHNVAGACGTAAFVLIGTCLTATWYKSKSPSQSLVSAESWMLIAIFRVKPQTSSLPSALNRWVLIF